MARLYSFLLAIGSCLAVGSGCATIREGEIERAAGANEPARRAALPAGGAVDRPPGWHEWRGFARDGVVAGVTLPETLPDELPPEIWRVAVGQGLSGVVAVGGRVFCHARVDEMERVTCHDAATGGIIWMHAYPISSWSQPFLAMGITDGPLATPTYRNGRLYTVGIHGDVHCFEAGTGDVVFSRTAREIDGQPSEYLYGHASSPLVRRGKLYIASASESAPGQMIALDAGTGDLVWRVVDETISYTSPVLARVHGTEQIILRTWQRVLGMEPDTGVVLWEHEAEASGMRRDCTTPLVVGDLVFVTNNFHGAIALRVLKGDDGAWSVERLYRTGALACAMSSPVYHDGHLYGLHKRGRFVCMDALTGERKWGARDFDEYVSMIQFGERVLALDDEGRLAVLRLSPESYRVEKSWKVGDYTWAHICIDEERIYFRDGEDLVARMLGAAPGE